MFLDKPSVFLIQFFFQLVHLLYMCLPENSKLKLLLKPLAGVHFENNSYSHISITYIK